MERPPHFVTNVENTSALPTSRQLLPLLSSRHRLRHPLLLGRPHDHARLPLHARRPHARRQQARSRRRSPIQRRSTSTASSATRTARRCPRPRATSSTPSTSSSASAPTPSASPSHRWPPPAPTSPSPKPAPKGYRAFANKIWNAARFLFMNIDRAREAERLQD